MFDVVKLSHDEVDEIILILTTSLDILLGVASLSEVPSSIITRVVLQAKADVRKVHSDAEKRIRINGHKHNNPGA